MRVAVVDDDKLICASLQVILDAQDDIEVVGMGCDGNDAVRLFNELHPDVMLLDIQMPRCDGLSAAEEILGHNPQARVVFLTTFSDDDYIVRALRYGARGYLIKQDVATIAPALRAVMNGQSVLEGEVLARVAIPRDEATNGIDDGPSCGEQANRDSKGLVRSGLAGLALTERYRSERAAESATQCNRVQGAVSERAPGFSHDFKALRKSSSLFSQLTEREYEVVQLVAQGFDNKEIASAVYMSEGTVRNHISSILAKLHLKNRTQIAVAFYRGTI